MDDDVPVSKVSRISRRNKPTKNVRQRAVLHMGVYDMEVANDIRKRVHQYYFESSDYTNPRTLLACFEALNQFYIVFKFSASKKVRKATDKRFEYVETKLNPLKKSKYKLNTTTYEEMRAAVVSLIEDVYRVKQLVGLGMPMERVRDAEILLEEAIES